MSKPSKPKNKQEKKTEKPLEKSSKDISFSDEVSTKGIGSSRIEINLEDLAHFDQKKMATDVSKYRVNQKAGSVNHKKIDLDTSDLNTDSDPFISPKISNLVYLQRSPRIKSSISEAEIEIPKPPQAPSKPEINWIIDLMQPIGMIMVGFVMASVFNPNVMFFLVPMAIINLVISVYRNKQQIKKYQDADKTRNEKYGKALTEVREKLNRIKEEYQDYMLDNHEDLDELSRWVSYRDRRLWERAPTDSDFLLLRLGIGSVSFPVSIKYPPKEISIVDDPLLEEALKSEETYRMVDNIPICLPILQSGVVGITGHRDPVLHTARALLIQLVANHSYDEVKIVAAYQENERTRWDWVKSLPHCSDNKQQIYAACGTEQARQLFSNLFDMIKRREMILNNPSESMNAERLPHYVFFISDRDIVENELIMHYLTSNNNKLGISAIFLFDQIENLPSSCNYIVNATEKQGQMLDQMHEMKTIAYIPDKITVSKSRDIATKMAPLRLRHYYASDVLPEQVSFLEMFGIERVEDLNIYHRWSNNKAYRSLATLIGVKSGRNNLSLDIHDRFHGPHGLVAGTTGSGKSELLQSLILSLSVNYHPHEIMFVLIDYKGGGMANVFKDLPHLAGIITNLGGNQTTRALLSVKSELRKRQALFEQAGVNHIDKYIQLTRQNRTEQAIPHLVIVVDEFAELKSEQPDFMRELVSTARVGRSLGVHLILATQKPAGIVDEQIWGNARFRICLKVQSTEDSQEVLKRADASKITLPGRSYLQVGNNEIYELFQSAYSGMPYNHSISNILPEGPIDVEVDNTKEIKTIVHEESDEAEVSTELNALVNHINHLAKKSGIEKLKGQWLPPLPKKIVLSELLDSNSWDETGWKENQEWLMPVVGLVDNPSNQSQYPLKINLGRDGHVAIYGSPGSGKTSFLQTTITSLAMSHNPERLNMYILDFGGRTLSSFSDLPHVGGVIMVDEEEKLKRLTKMLIREMDQRKRIFADKSVGSLVAYHQAGGEKLPAVVVVVDNYPAIAELYPDSEEFFQHVSREGGNLGVHLVISGGSVTSIQYKIVTNIKEIITFQLADKGDYSTLVGRTQGLEPESFDGRGLIKGNPPLEFQAALAATGETEADRATAMNKLVITMKKQWKGKHARAIPIIPDILKQEDLFLDEKVIEKMNSEPLVVALGLDTEELEPLYLNFRDTPHFLVSGKIRCGKTSLLKSIAQAFSNKFSTKNLEIYLVDSFSMGLNDIQKLPHVKAYAGNQPQLSDLHELLISKIDAQRSALSSARVSGNKNDKFDGDTVLDEFPHILMLIDDFNDFMQMADHDFLEKLDHLISRERNIKFYMVVAAMINDIGSSYQQLAKTIKDMQVGLLFGDPLDQQVFNLRIAYSEANTALAPGEGYLINRGLHKKVKVALS